MEKEIRGDAIDEDGGNYNGEESVTEDINHTIECQGLEEYI